MVDNLEIREVKKFWSENPMTYGMGKFKTPEDICNHAAAKAALTLNCVLWLRRLFFIILSPGSTNSNIFPGDKYI